MKPEQWIIEGEVGTSSRTIWAVMMSIVTEPRRCNQHYDIPHDPDDFSRCYKLIKLFPEWKERLQEVSTVFPKWIPYIREWDKLSKLYLKCVKDWHKHWNEMYDFMRELYREAMVLDGWVEVSPNSYRRG